MLRPPTSGDQLTTRTIEIEPLVLAVPADHHLATEPVVAMADLRTEDFVLYADSHSAVNEAVVRSCKEAGFAPHKEHEAPGTAVLLALIAAGLGVALVPASVRAVPLAGVVFRDVVDAATIELAVAWRAESPSPRPDGAGVARRGRLVRRLPCRVRPVPRGQPMKITHVEAIPFAIPYAKPLKFASGEVHVAEHVLVRVHTDDGVVGVAEAPPRPFTYGETQVGVIAVIEKIFAPAVIGLALTEREQIQARLNRTVGNPVAKSSLDMAIWDAMGKTLGFQVTELLGGYTDRMRVSHMLGFDEPAAMVAEAERMRDTYGITTFKVKVGRRPYSSTPRSSAPCGKDSATASSCTSTATGAGRPPSRPGP